MLAEIGKGTLARFFAFYIVWPAMSVALLAMGVTPDFFYSHIFGPDWANYVPGLLNQNLARWVCLGVGLLGIGWLVLRLVRESKLPNVRGIEVLPRPGGQVINGRVYDQLCFTFTNKTGRVVRISHPRIKETQRFPIPTAAVRNLEDGYCELKFLNGSGVYQDHQRRLEPNESAESGIAVQEPVNDDFLRHTPGFVRRTLRYPKYFTLRYEVLLAGKKQSSEIMR